MRRSASRTRDRGRTTWVASLGLLALALLVLVLLGRKDPTPEGADAAVAPVARGAATPAGRPHADPDAASSRDPASGYPHTELPLRLVATVVRENRAQSLATVEDLDRTHHQVISEGQTFRGHPEASLVRIERRRLILDNDGVREQLVLDPTDRAPLEPALGPTPEQMEYRRDLARRLREITDAGTDYLGRGERGGLLQEGDVSPVYEGEELVGVRFDDIRSGGVYDRLGLRNGDLVTSINGVSMGAPTAAADVLTDLAFADLLEVAVERGDGSEELLSLPTDQLTELLAPLQ